ncbi:MAG TPA: hypothetical protein VGO52_20650 [Hyphomonadaceae bacterium]|jgi:hypothetical protein|nr:hypothetical protein [Hyphomonadaceae bacterium]
MDPSHTNISTDNARQGETGHHVRYMLMFGTGLVVAAFAILAVLTF